MVVNKE
jgi:nicotinic acid phosphoribosyltransferase